MAGLSLNLIRVGADQFSPADGVTIYDALAFLKGTYGTVGVTIRRVEHYAISTAQASGRDIINNESEAEALTTEWTVGNNAIDVFVVRTFVTDVAGLSPVLGPCDKQAFDINGVVVELAADLTGPVLAHEVGHYLGLAHVRGDPANLMFTSIPNGGILTSSQGATMRSHCFIEA
jgi:hypothetical protein